MLDFSLISNYDIRTPAAKVLTPWELVYEYIIPRFRHKTSSLQLPYECHCSSTDCTAELFKPSKNLESQTVCTRKKFFGWALQIFCEWCHKWSIFRVIL